MPKNRLLKRNGDSLSWVGDNDVFLSDEQLFAISDTVARVMAEAIDKKILEAFHHPGQDQVMAPETLFSRPDIGRADYIDLITD